TVNAVAADGAVAKVRCEHGSVIRGDRKPTQLRWHACARVDLHERADADFAVFVDSANGTPIADGAPEDKGIRPAVQKGYVKRNSPSRVMERRRAERAVFRHRECDEAVGI